MFDAFLKRFKGYKIEEQDLIHAFNYYQNPINKATLSQKTVIQDARIRLIALSNLANRTKPNEITAEETRVRELQVEEGLKALKAGVFKLLPVFHNAGVKQGKAWIEAKNWNPVTHKFFILIGTSWAGKTFAGIGALTSKMEANKTPHGVNWNGLFVTMADLKDCMGADKDKKQKRDEIKNKPYLMIDDLQADEAVTPALVEWMKGLINYRHAQGKVTIITTNATEADLTKTYSEPIINRISSGLNVTVTQKIKEVSA